MAKEEVLEEFKDYAKDVLFNNQYNSHVDMIFEHFESRTCETCKFVEPHEQDEHGCEVLMAFSATGAEKLIEKGYGCNEWKKG